MASASSSSTDEIQLRKEVSSVKMDDVSIEAEKKKDLLEADIADDTLGMPEFDSVINVSTGIGMDAEMELSAYSIIDCIMERDNLEELDTAKNGGSCTLLEPNYVEVREPRESHRGLHESNKADSHLMTARNMNPELLNNSEDESEGPPVILVSGSSIIDGIIERDNLEELDTAKNGGSCTLLQPNDVEAREPRESHLDLHESNKADSHLMTARNMNPELLKAVKGGNIAFIKDRARDLECSSLLETSPKLNTILHVATSSGYEELVKVILETKWCEELVTRMNSTGNLALHVAASVGHLPIVKLLLSSYKQPEESRNSFGQLRMQNKEGNTPLHMALIKKYEEGALKSKYSEVASFLVETDPEGSIFQINNEGKSPLYLAAEAGDAELLKLIMDKFTRPAYMDGKSIVLAAIYGACTCKNIAVLDTVLGKLPYLVEAQMENKMTPLSYAASIGYCDGVQYILGKSPDCAYKSDPDGSFPVHMASKKGHIEVIKVFLEQNPDSGELLNGEGQNILHVAAVSGKAKVVAYLLKRFDLQMLINEKDKYGNTPLHLASKGRHPKVVSILTWNKRVNLKSLNNEGKTAFDIARNYNGDILSFRERLTWQALRYVDAPRAPPGTIKENLANPRNPHNTDKYNERVNTLLLVATLVATVTFAAAFTMPGGYNGPGGMATFLEKHMFQVFVICNTIAIYSAITVVVALIWAQLGDLNLIVAAFKFAVPILGLSITMVSVAFMVGNYLVLRNLNWLAYLVLIIGSFFLLTLLILFFPLCLPTSAHNSVSRYILYYPFLLLIKVTRSDINDREEK